MKEGAVMYMEYYSALLLVLFFGPKMCYIQLSFKWFDKKSVVVIFVVLGVTPLTAIPAGTGGSPGKDPGGLDFYRPHLSTTTCRLANQALPV